MPATTTRGDDPQDRAPFIATGLRMAQRGDVSALMLDRATLLGNGIVGFEHDDPRNRTFAMLRSQVLRRLRGGGPHVVAVTSTEAGSGKSFVAANLAAAMCQIHPVWLVDLDLRRPCVGERFGLPAAGGVDEYLMGGSAVAARRCHLDKDRLTILPVAQPRANSAQILSSDRTAGLFAYLRGLPEAPLCIIDTPPVLEGDDVLILAAHVDAILLVVEEGRTRQADLREILPMLAPTRVLGTVLNRTILPTQASAYGQYHAR